MLHQRGSCRRELNYVASYLVYTLVAIAAGDVSATIVPDGRVHLIQLPSRRAHIYDDDRGILYISTTAGSIERYDVSSKAFLEPLTLPGDAGTLELSPDNSYLYVTDWSFNREALKLNRIDLQTRDIDVFQATPVNPIPGLEPVESRFFDLAIGTQGLGLITSDFFGASLLGTPIRSFDSVTQEFRVREDLPFYPDLGFAAVANGAYVYRNAARDTILILESNISPGRARTFDAVNNRFIAAQVGFAGFNVAGAVSNDGSLVAVQGRGIAILTSALEPVTELPGYGGGFEFDPQRKILYAIDYVADQLAAINTDSWQELFRINLNEDVERAGPLDVALFFPRAGDGVISTSRDGRYLFLSTPSGIRVIDMVPEPSSGLLIFVAFILFGIHHRDVVRRRRSL